MFLILRERMPERAPHDCNGRNLEVVKSCLPSLNVLVRMESYYPWGSHNGPGNIQETNFCWLDRLLDQLLSCVQKLV